MECIILKYEVKRNNLEVIKYLMIVKTYTPPSEDSDTLLRLHIIIIYYNI